MKIEISLPDRVGHDFKTLAAISGVSPDSLIEELIHDYSKSRAFRGRVMATPKAKALKILMQDPNQALTLMNDFNRKYPNCDDKTYAWELVNWLLQNRN